MTWNNELHDLSSNIGAILAKEYPAVLMPECGMPTVPVDHAEAIANDITMVVAEILQSWLDAGSERDVTLEILGPAIEDHVRYWAQP
jgi:hypothetical protein